MQSVEQNDEFSLVPTQGVATQSSCSPDEELVLVTSSSSLSPIHEVRGRLDTAETAPIRNSTFPSSTHFAKSQIVLEEITTMDTYDTEQETANDMEYETSSIVSSLSNDDSRVFKRLPSMQRSNEDFASTQVVPPSEVSFPAAKETKVPDWPGVGKSWTTPDPPPPPVCTVGTSPSVVRPTLGRHKSCPPMDFSVTSSSYTTTVTPTSSTMESLIQELSIQNESVIATARLLGQRKQRGHHRARSAASVSVGSMVGQSSVDVTATSISSYAGSEFSRDKTAVAAQRKLAKYTGASDGVACCVTSIESKFRKRNVVADEIKHAFQSVVKTPLKIVKKNDNPDLQRSSGCLA